LAAELIMTGATMGNVAAIDHAASLGIGGVVLFGPSSPKLAQTLNQARAYAPIGDFPLIASDEEGGQVQRLGSLIYPLPSADVMGHWNAAKITATSRAYALRMKALGVDMSLSPDTDVAVQGYFIAATQRSFSGNPAQVAVDVNAWIDGLKAAGVVGVIKHWPGHGHATDTQVAPATTPPWSQMKTHDLIPFEAAFAHGAQAVLVGHLSVPGLTEGSSPASESPTALRTLRAEAGPTVLIMTDDLSMVAASTALHITAAQAAVRALVAGADVAMVCWAPVDGVEAAVTSAINDGQLPHSQAVASARRVLHLKTEAGSSD
jgi:beta-N-acetylhexosaminidase